MKFEFHKTVLPADLSDLLDFDRRIFGHYPDDLFGPAEWLTYDSFWMLADGVKVGCSALEYDVDYDQSPRQGALYIASTGILPEYQRQGLGRKQKEWQIEYARLNGFTAIVTNMRESNTAIRELNEALGFRVRGLHPDYYLNPDEPAVVMELTLPLRPQSAFHTK